MLALIILAAVCACDNGHPDQETEMRDAPMIILLDKALILRDQERMGTVFQSIVADVSQELRQGGGDGVQISSGEILEDYRAHEQVLLLFPAAPINGLEGQFVLALSVQSIDPKTPGMLTLRRAWMEHDGKQFAVKVETRADADLDAHWAYTRYPDMREVHVALFDDPEMAVESQVFHQTPFRYQPETTRDLARETRTGWGTARFVLDPYLVEQSRLIDRSEVLLEALDEAFSAGTGQYLQWSSPLVTPDRIEAVTSEVEARLRGEGESALFSVTIESAGTEIARGKRLQPAIRHPLTLLDTDGTQRPGTIGISVSVS
jgi:hypothetical protein